MSNRVVIVGFDALDIRYLDAFEESLPNFSSLRETGIEAPLDSTFPPWTGSAWPSLYTGCSPDYHGVFDFFNHTETYPGESPVVSRNDVNAPALWEYCDARGLTSIVLNVPVTHPVVPIDGAFIPGYLAPESASGHPDSIREELDDVLGNRYRIYVEREMADNDERKLDEYVSLVRSRGEAASYLLDKYDWDFAFIQVQKTDTVFHNFDEEEAFRRVYVAADEVLGRVLDSIEEADTMLVCSDHGMGPTEGYTVYLNEILKEAGFLRSSVNSNGAVLGDRKSDLMEGGQNDRSGRLRFVELVSRLSRALGFSPSTVYSWIDRVGFGEQLKARLPEKVKESMSEKVEWNASRAYCRSAAELGVRVNLKGREPSGIIEENEYESVTTELIELLESLDDPAGDRVFESVYRREDIYEGPYTTHACDVLVVPRDMNHSLTTRMYGTKFVRAEHHDHKCTGVFIGRGPCLTASPDSLSIVDIAPIAMATLNLPVPARMTGTVPDCVDCEVVRRESYDVHYGGESGVDGDSEVLERLEDLGYI